MAETLRDAVGGIPEASWTDSDGRQWSSNEILTTWSQDGLRQPVDFGENQFGMTTIRSAESGGKTILTMLGPSGPDIAPEPAVQPAE